MDYSFINASIPVPGALLRAVCPSLPLLGVMEFVPIAISLTVASLQVEGARREVGRLRTSQGIGRSGMTTQMRRMT